ncbi:hypothetical Protein YC6258_01121 [Gynuella sunshinyii YC6258]|uniref:Uncharacterized protein n=1 Tax=Gynuella sunshinyii YC6258 TaxID=1445510 RepID=A0A0C5VSC1_9GAMM|nr:hypothetical Protein YC6258_01121 [Gynuella sunshinyii YC6258]
MTPNDVELCIFTQQRNIDGTALAFAPDASLQHWGHYDDILA